MSAEVVSDATTRAQGLMHRRRLGQDAGMLFLFPRPARHGFWMKNTLVPLSIAFMDWDGGQTFRVLEVMDMPPCRDDPCPYYTPRFQHDAALEVNDGWFARHGIGPGATGETEGNLPTPD